MEAAGLIDRYRAEPTASDSELFEVLAGQDRTGTAARVLGEAKKRCEELETEVKVAFERLHSALEQNAQCGLEVEPKLGHPLDVAWDRWRRDKENREAVRGEAAERERYRAQRG